MLSEVARLAHTQICATHKTSQQIAMWVNDQPIPVLATEVSRRAGGRFERHLGEMAIQETMQGLAMEQPSRRGVFLFEDHKIARARCLPPPGCLEVSTGAWLLFLERKGWLESAIAIGRGAFLAGRNLWRLRFAGD